ncbi:MAG: Omp28-related outer membrane protein [Saprospiraceae bacterium]|nr:Omp28-related outer membrane protein [Saprospiraceae bacterium]
MMKKLSILFLALMCAAVVSAQHKRRVLIEEFTNASCPPCAAQNPAFNAVVAANMQYLTPIKYQTNWPGFDPMNVQTQAEVQPRVNYYGVTGVPNGRQNGTLEVFPMTSYTATMIQNAYNTLTPVTISISHALSAQADSVYVNVSVTSDAALTGNLRLRTLIVEEEIIFDAPPGSNGEQDFYQIMRKMLPDATGTATGSFTAGETKTYTFAWKLNHFYDLNQMSAAAFLQNDDTREVYQSERSEPLGLDLHDDGVIINSDDIFVCVPGFSPSVTMTNGGSEALTSALIRYREGANAWNEINWTGNLAPGESTQIELSNIVVNTSGNLTIDVQPVNSNLGTQIDFANGNAQIKVKALLDAAAPLPFANTFQSAAFPPTGWSVSNPTAANGWRLATNAGSGSTRSARCNFYDIAAGQVAVLTTPKIDLSAATNTSKMTFDHAYTWYVGGADVFWDSLRIEASADCGATWQTLFYDGYQGLATAPANGNAFVPTAAQWENNEIDITAFNGNANVLIRFTGLSGYGNNLYIDNLNISTTVGTKELTLTGFNLVPNPTRDYAEVRFGLDKAQNINLFVYAADGALVQSELLGDVTAGEHRVVLNASKLTSGSYRVVLQGSEGTAQTQWIVVK